MSSPITADDLPASPNPLQPEIKASAAEILNAEVWLQSGGWRRLVGDLNLAEGGQWLAAYRTFRLRIEHLEAQAHARFIGGCVIGVLAGVAASVAIGAWVITSLGAML